MHSVPGPNKTVMFAVLEIQSALGPKPFDGRRVQCRHRFQRSAPRPNRDIDGMGILRPAMHGMFIDTESSAVQHAERAEHRVAVTFAGLTATGSGSESAAGAA